MSLSSGERELLRRLIQGGYDGSNSDPKLLEKIFVSLAKKGLVKRNFGNPGSGFRRKRRGTRWDGRWELAVSPEEALAAMAVDTLSESSDLARDSVVLKGGSIHLTLQVMADPSLAVTMSKAAGKSLSFFFDSKKWIAK